MEEMQHAEFPGCLRFSFTRNKLEKSRKPSSSARHVSATIGMETVATLVNFASPSTYQKRKHFQSDINDYLANLSV